MLRYLLCSAALFNTLRIVRNRNEPQSDDHEEPYGHVTLLVHNACTIDARAYYSRICG